MVFIILLNDLHIPRSSRAAHLSKPHNATLLWGGGGGLVPSNPIEYKAYFDCHLNRVELRSTIRQVAIEPRIISICYGNRKKRTHKGLNTQSIQPVRNQFEIYKQTILSVDIVEAENAKECYDIFDFIDDISNKCIIYGFIPIEYLLKF